MTIFAIVLSLLFGWKWGALIGFSFIATLAVPLVILVYMMICIGCMWMYLTKMRAKFNFFLHLVLPIAGIVLFFFPLYYQFYKAPPTKPILYANWVAIAWTIAGIVLTVLVLWLRPSKVDDLDRVYVQDETAGLPPGAPAFEPTA